MDSSLKTGVKLFRPPVLDTTMVALGMSIPDMEICSRDYSYFSMTLSCLDKNNNVSTNSLVTSLEYEPYDTLNFIFGRELFDGFSLVVKTADKFDINYPIKYPIKFLALSPSGARLVIGFAKECELAPTIFDAIVAGNVYLLYPDKSLGD